MGYGGFERAASESRLPPLSKTQACDLMAELLVAHGIEVTPGDIRRLFHLHWERLSVLAHAIHEGR